MSWISLPLTWEAAGCRSGWGLRGPTGPWVSDLCNESCSRFESAGSSSPAPEQKSVWSPRRPRCSPRLCGRSRRCRPSQTPAPSADSWHTLGAPGSPAAEMLEVLWLWFLQGEQKGKKKCIWVTGKNKNTCRLKNVKILQVYHCYMVYRVVDSFPLLPSPFVRLPTNSTEETQR